SLAASRSAAISVSLKKSLRRSCASVAVTGTLFTFRLPRVGAVAIGTPQISAGGRISLFTECGFCKKSAGRRRRAMVTEPAKVQDDVAAPLERWILTPSDLSLILTKHHANRLSFAVLLAFCRDQGRFPRTASEVDDVLVEEIAQQLAIAIPTDFTLSLSGRTAERRRAEIRA